MGLSWDAVRVLPSAADTSGLIELSDSGWGQLIGWSVGVARLRRIVDTRPHVTTLFYPATGRRVLRPRSEEEQAEIEESINTYLAEAGVPPRPPGYIWYAQPPASIASEDDFWARFNEAQRVSTLPAEEIAVLQTIAAELYGP